MSNIAVAIDRRLLFEKNNTDPLQNSIKALHIDHEGAQTYQVTKVLSTILAIRRMNHD